MTTEMSSSAPPQAADTVILTVSGTAASLEAASPNAVQPEGDDARIDYLEMHRRLGYELLDESGVGVGRVPGLRHVALALSVFRRRSDTGVIVTDAEHTGLPLAILLRIFGRRGVRHVMIGHVLSSKGKTALIRMLGLDKTIDHVIVYSTVQQRLVEGLAGFGSSKVSLVGFGVDERFFDAGSPPSDARSICSVGLEGRDYRTLIDAVVGLDIDLEIAAGSHWATGQDVVVDELPPNVTMLPLLDKPRLRDLYRRSRFVVVPLHETDFQAGVTSIIEAMASGRALVYTRTRGQTDVIVDGVTGVPVAPGDVAGLRKAISDLLDDPDRAERMGTAGRKRIEHHFTLDRYVEQIGEIVEQVGS